jgi:hypothetical protein
MRKLLAPANVALALSVLVTCLWVAWGVPEMFHEGWYAPFEWLFFLLPAGVALALTLMALRSPRAGAALFVAIGLGFGGLVVWQYRPGSGRSAGWTLANLLSWIPVTLFLAVVGVLFYLGRRQRRRRAHYLAAVGVPLVLGLALAVGPAYRVSRRVDDGDRGERFVEGNGVALYWAPAGPGWDREGGVTWNEVALYGKGEPGFEGKRFGIDGLCNGSGDWAGHCGSEGDMRATNVCLYLNREGTQLMETRQDVWRMPTTDEVVRSLVRHGAHAGCAWDGDVGRPGCGARPDKETPLWDPQARVIYYWSAEEASAGRAYFVVYHGAVGAIPKFTAMGSRGYRCVREGE